jgi:hypothetical protein
VDDLILLTEYFKEKLLQGFLEEEQFFVIYEKIQELQNEENIQ